MLEQAQNLGLPGVRCAGGVLDSSSRRADKEPEDSDDAFAVFQRDRADVEHETRSVGGNQDTGRLGRRGRAEHLTREQLACPSPLLGADDDFGVARVASDTTSGTLPWIR